MVRSLSVVASGASGSGRRIVEQKFGKRGMEIAGRDESADGMIGKSMLPAGKAIGGMGGMGTNRTDGR